MTVFNKQLNNGLRDALPGQAVQGWEGVGKGDQVSSNQLFEVLS